jgi:hypothetical protein
MGPPSVLYALKIIFVFFGVRDVKEFQVVKFQDAVKERWS